MLFVIIDALVDHPRVANADFVAGDSGRLSPSASPLTVVPYRDWKSITTKARRSSDQLSPKCVRDIFDSPETAKSLLCERPTVMRA